ncbi:UvrD-helicase domain-containing protein [Myxococcota bacterium]|nr:UvrD-helicase domain-containing protein [Myxococcota bacterium]
MRLLADLHLHSRYTKTTSRDMDLENMALWARYKGIHLLGTGDFTHPSWLQELQEKLRPAEAGLFCLREDLEAPLIHQSPASTRAHEVRFVLSAEITQTFVHNGDLQRIRHLLFAPDFEAVKRIRADLARFGDIQAEGRPTLHLDIPTLLSILHDADPQAHLIPAHILASWFSLLGHRSAFFDVDSCFGPHRDQIFALESGLMIDIPQLRRIKSLDPYTLFASSNAYSPSKIGRAAIEIESERSYEGLFSVLRHPTPHNYLRVLETWPEEEKYYLDGHQRCRVSMSPQESRARDTFCPACKKPLTLGIMHRIEQLAQRPPSSIRSPAFCPPSQKLLSLEQILAELLQCNPRAKRLQKRYIAMIDRLGHEIDILRSVPLEELRHLDIPLLEEAVRRVRQEEISREPGFDGQPGKIRLFLPNEQAIPQQDLFPDLDVIPIPSNQLMLFDMASPTFWRRRIGTSVESPTYDKQFDLFSPTLAEPAPPYPSRPTPTPMTRTSWSPPSPPPPAPPLRQMDITEAIAIAIAARNSEASPLSAARNSEASPLSAARNSEASPLSDSLNPHASLVYSEVSATHRNDLPVYSEYIISTDASDLHSGHTSAQNNTTPHPTALSPSSSPVHCPQSFPNHYAQRIQQTLSQGQPTPPLSVLPSQKLSPPPFSPDAVIQKLQTIQERIRSLRQDPRASALYRSAAPPTSAFEPAASPTAHRSGAWPTLSALPKKLLARLNTEQRSAVKHWGSPLQMIAGPGTGKTYTLLHRILYLIATRQLDSSQILVFVHSEQAARSFSEQIQRHISPRHYLTITTFHRFCLELIAGEDCLPRLVSDVERMGRLTKIAAQQHTPLHDHEIPLLLRAISTAKQAALSPEEAADTLPEMNPRFRDIFSLYQEHLRNESSLDLDDLLLEGVRLLQHDTPLRQQLRLRFRSIHVDDYQDIYPAQRQILRHLVSEHTDLCVAGDPDQAIASTEGAELHHFYQFSTDFSTLHHPAQRYTLWRSYRSPKLLVDAAHSLISTQPDPHRTPTEALASDLQQQIPLQIFESPDEEARGIVKKIQSLLTLHPESRSPTTSFYPKDPELPLSFHPKDPELPLSSHPKAPELPLSFHPKDIVICYHHPRHIAPLRDALEEAGLPYWLHAHEDPALRQERHTLLARLRAPDFSASESPISLLDRLFSEIDQAPWPHPPQRRATQRAALYERARHTRNTLAFLTSLVLEQHAPLFPTDPHLLKLLPLSALKGLQFPVVFLAGCDDLSLPLEEMHPYPERIDEALRLLYTAIHRSERFLFLSYARYPQTPQAPFPPPQRASRFLEALAPFLLVQSFPSAQNSSL